MAYSLFRDGGFVLLLFFYFVSLVKLTITYI